MKKKTLYLWRESEEKKKTSIMFYPRRRYSNCGSFEEKKKIYLVELFKVAKKMLIIDILWGERGVHFYE